MIIFAYFNEKKVLFYFHLILTVRRTASIGVLGLSSVPVQTLGRGDALRGRGEDIIYQ